MLKLRRIPTILGLFILLAGIAAGVFLIQKGLVWFLRAEPTTTPKQVKITNISDNSFAVSWITEGKVAGFIKYSPTLSLDLIAVDDRDQISGETASYTTHHATIRGLEPATKYYFKIGSGKNLYDNNGKPYEVTTAPTTTNPPLPSDPAYGAINKPDNSPAAGAIVYLSLANTTPLSALTKNTGSWLITLNNARTIDLSTYASYDREASIEEIFVQGGAMGTATAVVTTKNDSPVPTIALGKSYDFRQAKASGEPTATPTPSDSKFSLEPIEATPAVEKELTIINPSQGEKISTQKPEILGQGPAGVEIDISLESPATYSGKIKIGTDGNWNWSPPEDLEPGEHTVTAKYTDENGIKHLISRSFVVLAAGEELAFEASPSATPTPSLSPTPTATPSPTPTLTITPTPTPPARAGVPSTEAGVPEPGYLTPTFLLFIIGFSLIIFGLLSNSLFMKKIF